MALVTSADMFQKAYEGGYAIGGFNVNNMEIIQGIVEAGNEERSPLILQVSAHGLPWRRNRLPGDEMDSSGDGSRHVTREPYVIAKVGAGSSLARSFSITS